MAWLPCTYPQIKGVLNTAHHTHCYLESFAAVFLWEVIIIVPLSWQQYRWMRASYPCGASAKAAMIKTILSLCCLNHITLCNGLSFFGWIDIRGHIFSANVQWHEPQSVKCGIVSPKQVREKKEMSNLTPQALLQWLTTGSIYLWHEAPYGRNIGEDLCKDITRFINFHNPSLLWGIHKCCTFIS